jgi:hypothetical protein
MTNTPDEMADETAGVSDEMIIEMQERMAEQAERNADAMDALYGESIDFAGHDASHPPAEWREQWDEYTKEYE